MTYDNLNLSLNNHIATLVIDQPKTLNSLDMKILGNLELLIDELVESPEVKVVIISGAGEKAFVAGGDIGAMQPLGPFGARRIVEQAQRIFNKIEFSRKIFIAAINGYALGAGCELAMACDIRLAARHAKLGQPEIRLGIIPGWGGTQRLPRLVGKGKAKELMLTGGMIDAEEAHRIGLVNQVYPGDILMGKAIEMADDIAAKSQLAVRLIKEAVDNGLEMPVTKAFNYEAELFSLCFAGEDQKEGMLAFLEKRSPTWKDC